jgi:hypothetical protein
MTIAFMVDSSGSPQLYIGEQKKNELMENLLRSTIAYAYIGTTHDLPRQL